MADERLVTPQEKAQEQERMAAREAEKNPRKMPADETEPGGKFIVNDVEVDSEGVPLKDKK